MKGLKKNLPSILMILLGIGIGVLLIIDAVQMTEIIFRVIGAVLTALAVVLTIRYLIDRKNADEGGADPAPLVTAVIAFIIGLVLLFGARMIVEAGSTLCAIFYGAVMIVNGILKISQYFSMKKQGAAVSALMILSGVVSLALGVTAIAFCGQALKVLGIIIGITLIVESILDIIILVVGHRKDRTMNLYDTSGDDRDYDLE